MTLRAYQRSALAADPRLATDLGLDPTAADPFSGLFGPLYFDAVADRFSQREANPFEASHMPRDFKEPLSIAGWLLGGTVREDDLKTTGCWSSDLAAYHWPGECNPQDDPYENANRVLNHFYDPYFDRGFTSLLGSGTRAPDWATGSLDAFQSANRALADRANHFTLMDARRSMYFALTGRGPGDLANSPEWTRNHWWATTFRSLGDAMHLLQDMAQPQHTRIAAHPGSVFERYIDARARGLPQYDLFGNAESLSPLPTYNGFSPVTFDRYARFWSGASGPSGSPTRGATVLQGNGLADFSNRGFFAEGSNFGSSRAKEYPAPSNNRGDYGEEDARPGDVLGGTVSVRFLKSRSPETFGMRATTESAFKRFLPASFALYTMNRQVFDDQVDRLVPQAIRYSWGLLDHFFRGRIDCKLFAAYPNACIVRNLGDEPIAGTLELFYDAQDGTRRAVAGSRSTEKVIVDVAGAYPMAFATPVDPPPKKPGEYVLVFDGDMGQEKADPSSGSVGAVLAKIITPRRYLAAGLGEHSVLADENGIVWAWGDNEFGQLGTGSYWFAFPFGADSPVAVLGPNRFPVFHDVVEVAKGASHSLLRRKDGTVWGWGNGEGVPQNAISFLPVQLKGFTLAAAIAAGGLHSIVARQDGSVWTWGFNDAGQVGDGTIGTPSAPGTNVPTRLGLENIRAVAAGDKHSLALRADGVVFAWGENRFGAIGNGAFQAAVASPSPVAGLGEVIAIAAGASHNLALKRDGTVWSWGANTSGQLGDGSVTAPIPGGKPLPTQVAGLTDVVAIAAGAGHSMAARRDGTVWTWGANSFGQLGNGLFSGTPQPFPAKVPNVANIVEVSGGYYHSLALRIDGTIWAWGRDWLGELGDGTTTTASPYGKSAAVEVRIDAF